MGWEDVWGRELERAQRGGKLPAELAEQALEEDLAQETPNHKLLRLATIYTLSPFATRHRRLLLDFLASTRRDHMAGETGTSTYAIFWELGMARIALTAWEAGDTVVSRRALLWWQEHRAMLWWMSVPPAHGVPNTRHGGQADVPIARDVVGVGVRHNQVWRLEVGIVLRLLCGLDTRWDRGQVERAAARWHLNTANIRLVAEMAEERLLPIDAESLDDQALAPLLPNVSRSIHIERWGNGFRAWAPELAGVGPAQTAVRVQSGKLQVDRPPRDAHRRPRQEGDSPWRLQEMPAPPPREEKGVLRGSMEPWKPPRSRRVVG